MYTQLCDSQPNGCHPYSYVPSTHQRPAVTTRTHGFDSRRLRRPFNRFPSIYLYVYTNWMTRKLDRYGYM